jgi:RNA polymerase sigma-70 factor (sigma-E family)
LTGVAKAALRSARVDAPAEPGDGEVPAAGPADFAALYERAYPEMARLAVLLVGSREAAHDVVQESFVRLHRAWDRAENPPAYLRRIVVNECTSYHRRRFRQRRVQPLLRPEPVELAADEISDALAVLTPRQRAAIVLRYWHGCSEAEIAEVLGCKPGTVGSLVHRGLAELRQVIEP